MKNENVCTHDIKLFRERIEQLRGDTPQKEFCEGIGVSVRTYQNWVNPLYKGYNGKTSYTLPNIETAMRICDKYKVSLDFLFGRIDCETVTNQAIKDMIGIDDKGIAALKDIKQSDDNYIFNEQPGLCVLPVLNDMLSVGYPFEQLLNAFRDFLHTDYCVPVYHTGKGALRNSKRLKGKILDNETVISTSDLDKIGDNYIQHFARENDLYDNKPVVITKQFLEGSALQSANIALMQIKNSIENKKS